MTIAKDFASKFAVAFVAAAMILTAIAPAVQAAEADDLQTTINDLLAQVADLQGQLGDDDAEVVSADCESIAAPLTIGSMGAGVTALQNRLIANGHVIAAGATGYFGAQTKAALAAWQAANNVAPAAGYYGPLTMAAMDAACVPADEDEDTDEDTDEDSDELQGEGSLDASETDLDDASDSDIQEGEEDAELGTLTLAAEDGDIELSRIDFSLVDAGGTANESDLWDTFETISLWVDGDMIGEFDASDEDEYLDEDLGTFRISGLDLVIMEDDEVAITIGGTVMNSVDGSDTATAADWDLDATDVRYFDADGVASDDTITVSTVEIDIVEEGTDDDATIESSSDNPEAMTLKVDEDGDDSEEFDIFMFEIDVDEDSSDLVFNEEAFVDVTVLNPAANTIDITADDVIESVYLTIGGEKVEGDAPAGTANGQIDHVISHTGDDSNVIAYSFDFEDVELPAGEIAEATVSVVFKGQDSNYENNVVVSADVDGADWEVEGLSGDADVLTGTEGSEDMTLATVVPVISDVEAEVTADDPNNSGTISFEFTVEAEDDDVTLAVASNSDVNGAVGGVRFTVTGTDTNIATTSLSLVSGDATYGAGVWTIEDGDEATFALDTTFATVNSGDNGTYRVTLDEVGGVEVDETSGGLGLAN